MKKFNQIFIPIFVSILAVLHMIPIAVMFINSIRDNETIKSQLLGIPQKPVFQNYVVAWVKGGYSAAYKSNLIIGTMTVLVVLIVITLASYGITKLDIYFKNFFTGYFISSLSIPAFAIIVPLYFMLQKFGLVNNYAGIILIYAAISIPFNFLFMRAFFLGMPKELEEAARIDGCSELLSLWYITFPLAKPVLTTVALTVFVNSWNEFLFANTFLQTENLRTVALRFFNFVGKTQADYGYVFAAACISIVPIIFVYVFLQNSFIEGMTQGGVKG